MNIIAVMFVFWPLEALASDVSSDEVTSYIGIVHRLTHVDKELRPHWGVYRHRAEAYFDMLKILEDLDKQGLENFAESAKQSFDSLPENIKERWRVGLSSEGARCGMKSLQEANLYQLYFYHSCGKAMWHVYDSSIFAGFRFEKRRAEHIEGLEVFDELVEKYKRIIDLLR